MVNATSLLTTGQSEPTSFGAINLILYQSLPWTIFIHRHFFLSSL